MFVNKKLLITISTLGMGALGIIGIYYAKSDSIDELLEEQESIVYEDIPKLDEVYKPPLLPETQISPVELIKKSNFKNENPHTNVDQKITKKYLVRDRWDKRISRDEGKKKIDLIREYSVKISNSVNCTGWFLDYEIPENEKKYPTKWFIATNLHCILGMPFKSDYYGTTLPKYNKGSEDTYIFTVSKENIDYHKDHPEVEFKPENWSNYRPSKKPVVWNVKADALKTMTNPKPDVWKYTDLNPKLVYVAIDFLGDHETAKKKGYSFSTPRYFKDFAVIEINFDTEEQAQRTTWDFYNKYDPVVGKRKEEGIDFFKEELIARKTPDQLIEEQENFFISGYPSNAWDQHISINNFNENLGSASRLTKTTSFGDYEIKNEDGEAVLGHLDSGNWLYNYVDRDKMEIRWNGEIIRDWGYRYSLDYTMLEGGASGSLTIDSSNNLLGLYSYRYWYGIGGIEPIRSKGIIRNGRVITPAYDLIEGVEGQVSSYKSQIEKHFLKKGIKTNLSRQRAWTPKG